MFILPLRGGSYAGRETALTLTTTGRGLSRCLKQELIFGGKARQISDRGFVDLYGEGHLSLLNRKRFTTSSAPSGTNMTSAGAEVC